MKKKAPETRKALSPAPQPSDSLEQKVASFLAEGQLLAGIRRVLVGFSGGADSTALLLILHNLQHPVVAVHLQHGLRGGEAEQDAVWCETFCRNRNIPFERFDLNVPARRRAGESLEEAARRCRLEYWRQRGELGDAVALGHHEDDALEDFLLRCGRGAGASGLTGLRPLRILHGVRIIRPLLGCRRDDIQAYLRRQGITDWREDRSNREIRFRRNAVRHEWLPLMRKTIGHDRGLLASLAALREDADYLEAEAARILASDPRLRHLRELHPALLPRVLRLWLEQQLGYDLIPSRTTLLRLRQALSRGSGRAYRIPVGKGVTLQVRKNGLTLDEVTPVPVEIRWPWRHQPSLNLADGKYRLTASETMVTVRQLRQKNRSSRAEYFTPDALPKFLTVRTWRSGDRLRLFNSPHAKKLQDLFSDAKIPPEERSRYPVVLAGETIIWLAGVRRAEFGRVSLHPRAEKIPVVRLTLTLLPHKR